MRKPLGFVAGFGLAVLGVSGLAGGGLLWNFQGRVIGLSTTITGLVLLAISVVLLRPLPTEQNAPTADGRSSTSLQAPRASIIGVLLAVLGSFGLAGSGILWNFNGVAFGLTGTITSLVALALSVLFLRPLGGRSQTDVDERKPESEAEHQGQSSTTSQPGMDVAQPGDQIVEVQEKASDPVATQLEPTTTAEDIAKELAAAQQEKQPVVLSTFAPEHLLAGQSIPIRRRRSSSSLKRYRVMAGELFRS